MNPQPEVSHTSRHTISHVFRPEPCSDSGYRYFPWKSLAPWGRTGSWSVFEAPDRAVPGHQRGMVNVAAAALDLGNGGVKVGQLERVPAYIKSDVV